MSSGSNVRVLCAPSRGALIEALLEVEGDAAAAARVAAKAHHRLLRADGLGAHTAMLLKQELLALGADALISPAVYLGERDAVTGAVIFASDRQLAELVRRLAALPLPALQALGAEIASALAGHDAPRKPLALPGGRALAFGGRMLVLAPIALAPKTPPDSVVARARELLAGGADALELALGPRCAPEDGLAAVAAAALVIPTLVRDDVALALRAGVPALLWAEAGAPLAELRARVGAAGAAGAGEGRLAVGARGGGAGAPPGWLGELRALGLPVVADLAGLAGEAEAGAGVALAAAAGADAVLAARPGAALAAARVVGARRG